MTEPNPPAPMQPAPSPTGGGAESNPTYAYRCEVCGDEVEVDYAKAEAETKARNRRPLRWGVVVRCALHLLPGKQPTPPHQSEVRAPHVHRPRSLPPIGGRFNLDHSERMSYGATITAVDEAGHVLTLVGVGPVTKALGDVCDHLDRLNEEGGHWRIVTVSTPATVYADLQGMRDEMTSPPETRLLAMVHRLDLLYRPPSGFQHE